MTRARKSFSPAPETIRPELHMLGLTLGLLASIAAAPAEKPLFKDFMGLNVHTVQFKPELYKPTVRWVRDYHPIAWDLGDDGSAKLTLPKANNGVDWKALYGDWQKHGYEIDVCAMFESIDAAKWGDISQRAFEYGESFAKVFGPSGDNKLVRSIEIGNEPSKYDDATNRKMFEAMAKGVRKGDPKLTIVTCAVNDGKDDIYAKDINSLDGLQPLYDVINIHDYAFAEMWPTFRRSYPEDPSINYLKYIDKMTAWRNAHAKGKPIWVTEFGWDSATKAPDPKGDWAKWVGATDTQQAQYLIRSFLAFSAMDVEKAFIYFFNDDDQASLHAASGITRKFQPKPSFYSTAHLLKILGEYRFSRVVTQKVGEVYVYEYKSPKSKDKILAVWSPTGSNREATMTLPKVGKVLKTEQMPLADGPAPAVAVQAGKDGSATLKVSESPTFLWVKG